MKAFIRSLNYLEIKRISNYLKNHHRILKKVIQIQLLSYKTRKESLNEILRQCV